MGKVEFDGGTYVLDGERIVIAGGTLQFFRVPKNLWKERLERMVRAGLNTVDTYVAWNWHEPEKNNFDFSGETHPQRDLEGFIELAEEKGLYVIIRPGPYICGEWRNGGIPDWFINEHPESLARGPEGPLPDDIYYRPITYLHPEYLKAAEHWYSNVLRVIKRKLYTHGGPIISVTLDDEPSYWETIFQPFLTDYNAIVTERGGLWHEWLRENYEVGELKRRYGENIEDYTDVNPPTSFSDPLPKILDWHHFKIWMINRYVEFLYRKMIESGVDVPISLLDPYLHIAAWRYFHNYIKTRKLNIHLWTEFWYSFYRSFDFKEDKLGHLFFKTAVYRLYSKETPGVSIETQSSLAHTIEPDEAELLYGLLPALGIPNINYYLLVGGENPAGYESHNGVTWDVYSPMGLDGSERPHLEVIKRVSSLTRTNREIALGRIRNRVAFGFYEPYEAVSIWNYDDLEESTNLNEYLLGERGLLTLLAMSNTPFDAVDLESASLKDILGYEQLWVYSLDFMDRKVQEKLAEFVEAGGNLVILPMLPHLDENMEPCSILSERLGVKVEKVRAERNPRLIPFVSISAEGIDRMIVRNRVRKVEGGEPVAWAGKKPVAAFIEKGRGSAVILGFRLQYFSSYHDLHRKFVNYIQRLQGVDKQVKVSNSDLIVIPIETEKGTWLSVANPRGHPVDAEVEYRELKLKLRLEKRAVLYLPVNVRRGRLNIRWATAEPVEVDTEKLVFRNHAGGKSEISIEGHVSNVEAGKNVAKVEIEKHENETIVKVEHEPGNFEIILKM